MIQDCDIENAASFRAALGKSINLFTGAGFSCLASDRLGRALPVGDQLRDELVAAFGVEQHARQDLPRLVTILKRTHAAELETFLRDRLTATTIDQDYSGLINPAVCIDRVFTTNIDNTIELIYANHKTRYVNDVQLRGASFQHDYYKLNGSVTSEHQPLSFSATELATRFRTDAALWHALTVHLARRPTLFWGYSVRDSPTLDALAPETYGRQGQESRWLLVHPSASDSDVEYFRSLGFQIVRGTTRELLALLASIPATAEHSPASGRDTRARFPKESIPRVHEVPARPLKAFFQGSAPEWVDVFSGLVPRTHHFQLVKNEIDRGRNVAIIGVLASGKSTLLMQLAAAVQSDAHTLLLVSPTNLEAQSLVRRLAGDRAIVFVDDFSYHMEAIATLLAEQTIQLVVCDREYRYDIVSHLTPSKRFEYVSLNKLTRADIVDVGKAVTGYVVSAPTSGFSAKRGEETSIYEVVEYYSESRSLNDRVQTLCSELRAQNPLWLELLLMCSYVHYCRSPVSMDMLMLYFSDDLESYQDIFAMVSSVGGMLREFGSQTTDDSQDYFAPRSTLFADALMRVVRPVELAAMLRRFHNSLSAWSIHDYQTFRFQAFDADLFTRAFPDWKDGLAFYEQLWRREPSAFKRQQGALYLHRLGQNRLAFSWIDDAIRENAGRAYSIRNTHAVILFNVNIEFDPTTASDLQLVLETLRESMQILESCISQDERKAYHVRTYAEQAISYANRYQDQYSLSYLAKAVNGIRHVLDTSPYERPRYSALLKKLEGASLRVSASRADASKQGQ
jgi:energy-coupling factor transporter ATP-binding protein EcfA2